MHNLPDWEEKAVARDELSGLIVPARACRVKGHAAEARRLIWRNVPH
jgi:hypothetical protein